MAFEIRMPKLSDNMEEGTLIRWIVDKGQSVNAGDPIAEVETDKADVEIEAEKSGVVSEIRLEEGGVAAVGDVIAVLGDEDGAGRGAKGGEAESSPSEGEDDVAPDGDKDGAPDQKAQDAEADTAKRTGRAGAGKRTAEAKREADEDGERQRKTTRGDAEERKGEEKKEKKREDGKKAEEKKSQDDRRDGEPRRREAAPGGGEDVLASPMARELAARRGLDLAQVRGSGPGGRIVKADVEAAAGRGPQAGAPAEAERRGKQPEPADADEAADDLRAGPSEMETMSRMRRTIAARMEKSKREIPHFYVRTEVDVGDLMRLYDTVRRDELVPGLTITHLLLRAIASTMPDHPRLNALWVDDSIQLVDDVNIGVVVALDDGLLVPVLKRAQELGLRDLVEQTRALIERTRKGRFRSEDLSGGTISVSNIGMLDVDELTPVINPPQASILGVGAVRDKALVRDGELVAGRVMTLTLACDHRIVHGVEAGRFLEDLKHALERPLGLIVLA